jgi:hypothetical protein
MKTKLSYKHVALAITFSFTATLLSPVLSICSAKAAYSSTGNTASFARGILLRFSQHDPNGPGDNDEPQQVLRERQERYKEEFEAERGLQLHRVTDTTIGEVYLMTTDATSVEQELNNLKGDSRIDNACPNYVTHEGPPPTTEPPTGYIQPDSVTAPNAATGRDGLITVACLDAGLNQDDFSGDLWTDPTDPSIHGFTILNGITANTPQEDSRDPHGSAVSGIVRLNFQRGAQATGKDFKALILMIRVIDYTGLVSSADELAGARLVLAHAKTDASIRVLNLSLGDGGYDPFLEETLTEFFSIGGVTSAAAGNGDNGHGRNLTGAPLYPGGFCLRVPMATSSAVDQINQPTVWSDYYNLTTTWAVGVGVDSGLRLFLSGTSATAPQVAAGLGLRLLLGDPPAGALQAVIYSAGHRDDLDGRVIPGGGVYNLTNLVTGNAWATQIKFPTILAIDKAKAGKIMGSISDPSLKVDVIGYPDLLIQVQEDGSIIRKNAGLTHSPVWMAAPLGWAVVSHTVKGL